MMFVSLQEPGTAGLAGEAGNQEHRHCNKGEEQGYKIILVFSLM